MRVFIRMVLIVLCCASGFGAALGLTTDPLAQFKRQSSLYPIRRIALSPDSSELAYVVQVPSEDGTRNQLELRVVNVVTKQRVHISCAEDDATDPSWSPDGTQLAFVKSAPGLRGEFSDHGVLSIYDLHTKHVRSFPASISSSFILFPMWIDDHHILAFDVSEGSPHQTATDTNTAGIRVFTSTPADVSSASNGITIWRNIQRNPDHSASVVDISSGEVRSVLTSTPIAWPELSPNGRYLAFAEYRASKKTEFVGSYVVNIVDLHDGSRVQLPKQVNYFAGFWHVFTWRPDSAALAYPNLDEMSATGSMSYRVVSGPHWDHIAVFDPPSVPAGVATEAVTWSVDGNYLTAAMGNTFITWRATGGPVLHVSAPVTGAYIQQLAATPDPQNRIVAVATTIPENGTKLIAYDASHDTLYPLASFNEEPMPQWGTAVFTKDREKLLFTGYSLNRFVEVQSVDLHGDREELTDGDNKPAAMYAELRTIAWRDANGRSLRGGLLLPKSYNPKDKLPLIVRIYPGEDVSYGADRYGLYGGMDAHSDNLMLVAAGYALFFPSCPIRPDALTVDLMNDVYPGIQRVIDTGVVDPERIGLIGQSDGVQASLNLMTSSTQFKAAVLSDGFANFFTAYGDMSGYGVQGSRRFAMSAPWETPQKYIENSPLFHLDRINAPILLFHGTDDKTVPLYAGEELFTDLRTADKTVTLVEYEGGDHIMSGWTLAQQVDAMKRTLEWYGQYLKVEKSPSGN
jgi:dipeptidyl aminopeptidase/acylaminoacyl peptidase